MRVSSIALLGLGLAACYAPTPPAGAPCADGQCPSGLVCATATQTCELANSDAAGGDPTDGTIGTDASGCYGTGVVRVCPVAPPAQVVTFGVATTIDTDGSPMCVPYTGGSPGAWCLIAGDRVVVTTTVTATGSRPLVILGTTSITIDGTLDVASHRTGGTGAGANGLGCSAGTAASSDGGGAGGSFGGRGGNGGTDGGAASMSGAPIASVTALRGGCRGTNGHTSTGSTYAAGGAGGGAIYLISTGSITNNGTINASGAGGAGGAAVAGGGGGGGSGGMIGIDAPSITDVGVLFANGGGGGGGAKDTGGAGAGADPAFPMIPASGGGGACANCGDGGSGAAGVTLGGSAGMSAGISGGGGGGGAGVIEVVPAQSVGGTVSPPPS